MKGYRRNYNTITDDDVVNDIASLKRFDRFRRKYKGDDFYDIYVNAERDANIAIPEDIRKIYRAQQIIKELDLFVKVTKCIKSKMNLVEDAHKEHKWLKNKELVRTILNKPSDPDYVVDWHK